jgi:2-hydroxycyclohexanecarboxyl-CoA dehydrogenase
MSENADNGVAAARVAGIAGGASGVGLAAAQHLVDDGHPVVLLPRQGDLAMKEAESLQTGGAQAIGVEVDVTDRASVDTSAGQVREQPGPSTMRDWESMLAVIP